MSDSVQGPQDSPHHKQYTSDQKNEKNKRAVEKAKKETNAPLGEIRDVYTPSNPAPKPHDCYSKMPQFKKASMRQVNQVAVNQFTKLPKV